jgi:hypothetical protein
MEPFSTQMMLFQDLVICEVRAIITGRRNTDKPISNMGATGCERWHNIRFFIFGTSGMCYENDRDPLMMKG